VHIKKRGQKRKQGAAIFRLYPFTKANFWHTTARNRDPISDKSEGRFQLHFQSVGFDMTSPEKSMLLPTAVSTGFVRANHTIGKSGFWHFLPRVRTGGRELLADLPC
jgi:hypothetical protein